MQFYANPMRNLLHNLVFLNKKNYIRTIYRNMIKEKLLNERLKKGLSQEELADLVGMTQSNYSRREKGLKKISDAEWNKIAKELKVQKEDIYQEDSRKVVSKNNNGNSFNSGTIYFNMPDFVLEHIELLKKENNQLKEKLKELE